jgi:hypothetical protein
LEIDLKTGNTRQYAISLTKNTYGFSEILALSNHEFLAIERDDGKGIEAAFKRIVKLDISGATDIQNLHAIPANWARTIRPVAQETWLDFLNPQFGLVGTSFPEKIEGMTWGPTFPDGRRLLVVTTDNDCDPAQPSEFWLFAITAGK